MKSVPTHSVKGEKMELIFLGTSSAIPTNYRNHSAIALKAFGEIMLFDCGEGTQRQMARARLSPMKVDKIFITHLHGDHILGVPGIVQSMAFRGRLKPLHIFGPKGISQFVENIKKLGYFSMSFQIHAHEVDGRTGICAHGPAHEQDLDGSDQRLEEEGKKGSNEKELKRTLNENFNKQDFGRVNKEDFDRELNEELNEKSDEELNDELKRFHEVKVLENENYTVTCCNMNHTVPDIAYRIEEKRNPKFLKEKAIACGVKPGPDFGKLQRGIPVKVGSRTVKPEEVLGAKRVGRKIVYSGDTRPCKQMIRFAENASVLIHESTFDSKNESKAYQTGHSTAAKAAEIAERTHVKKLVLTHISTRYKETTVLEKEAADIFEDSVLAEDLMSLEVERSDR